MVLTALALSYFLSVAYIYTLIGFSAWALFGHLITADDDASGGWSNPDGSLPFPWLALFTKALVFITLCALAFFVPAIRSFGVAQ